MSCTAARSSTFHISLPTETYNIYPEPRQVDRDAKIATDNVAGPLKVKVKLLNEFNVRSYIELQSPLSVRRTLSNFSQARDQLVVTLRDHAKVALLTSYLETTP